ncbi:hypothetical protein BDQ17DRAFT_1349174 [Cyathus striatus]|nr:hypothetical protein BDQ17DRAFT_1349174 [Cyathus striatus]
MPYHLQLASDITALINHLYPDKTSFQLYIAGGSYGTAAAQMLYGASYDIFPPGKYLRGCLLLAALSPPLYHKGYTKGLSLQSYMAIGPPSRWIPWNMLQRLAIPVIKGRLSSLESAEAFLRSIIFDKMDDEEKSQFNKWREERGKEEGEVERNMARNMMKSIEKTWSGFLEVSDVLHSDWGFDPGTFRQQNNAPVVLVCSKGDDMAPEAMAKWLDSQYSNSQLIMISGGHLAGLYETDRLWEELLDSTMVAIPMQ